MIYKIPNFNDVQFNITHLYELNYYRLTDIKNELFYKHCQTA